MQATHAIAPLPAQACDCHVHVFDPQAFPFAPQRAYTPGAAPVADLQALHRSLGLTRAVLVQPSVYGTDNACLLDAIARLGPAHARGVAVVDPHTVRDAALQKLHDGGVRGLRLNLHVGGDALSHAREQVMAAGRVAQSLGWHLQVHAGMALIVALREAFAALDVPVVLDHFAGAVTSDAAGADLLAHLLDALRDTRLHVKLSAAYRLPPGCCPITLARRFDATAPDRVLWGSDWPHTGGSGGQGRHPESVEPFRAVDERAALMPLLDALGGAQAAQRVLVDNPARLYGF